METLRNQDVWKRACKLSAELYEFTSNSREHSFKGQVTRAGLSVASNIAEGYQCSSVNARIKYLDIAKNSCANVWTQLMIGRSASLINSEDYAKLELEASEISKMLWDVIKQLQKEQEKELATRT